MKHQRRAATWRYRLFFAIGLILLTHSALTLLPALWWSDIPPRRCARSDDLVFSGDGLHRMDVV